MTYHRKSFSQRRCELCRKWFRPRACTNILCSGECRKERKRRICAEWYKVHADYHIRNVVLRRKKRRSRGATKKIKR